MACIGKAFTRMSPGIPTPHTNNVFMCARHRRNDFHSDSDPHSNFAVFFFVYFFCFFFFFGSTPFFLSASVSIVDVETSNLFCTDIIHATSTVPTRCHRRRRRDTRARYRNDMMYTHTIVLYAHTCHIHL